MALDEYLSAQSGHSSSSDSDTWGSESSSSDTWSDDTWTGSTWSGTETYVTPEVEVEIPEADVSSEGPHVDDIPEFLRILGGLILVGVAAAFVVLVVVTWFVNKKFETEDRRKATNHTAVTDRYVQMHDMDDDDNYRTPLYPQQKEDL